jgi:hypothetical protein
MSIRGPGLCLATMGRDSDSGRVDVVAAHVAGWYDTGDLAGADERGGSIQISKTRP